MKLKIFIITGLLFTVASVFAQKGVEDGSKYGHGEDSIRCRANSSLYYENYRNKNYKGAFPYWEIVFNECPLSSLNVFSQGATIVQNMIDEESDSQKKEDYYQLLMKVYDLRMKYFGDHKKYPASYIQGIKAVSILKNKRDEIPAMKEAEDLFSKAIAERGDNAQVAVITTYFTNTIALYKADELSAEDVISVYLNVSDILNSKLQDSTDEELEQLKGIVGAVEKMFGDSGVADCETIQKIFEPKYAENKTNVEWLKRVSSILNQQLCDNDLVFNIAESIHKIEPSPSSARGMAVKCLKTKDFDGAVKYYKEAISLATTKEDQANYNYELGLVYITQNSYQQAKTYLKNASDLRPNWGMPYMQIGLIYGLSAANCGEKEFDHKCAYWASVDKFMQAKAVDPSVTEDANKQIATFSAYFPNNEELFFYNMKEGDPYKVSCWINESTKVRAKK